EAFTAAARHQPGNALRHARDTLSHVAALGITHECLCWAWPLAARAAHDLDDVTAVGELLTLLDSYQPGHLAPMLRAERDLARAPPRRPRRRPRYGIVRPRDRNLARVQPPLPPRPWPARPGPAPQPQG